MMPWALVFDLAKAGRSIPARIAMIAITTSNSIKVKPRLERDCAESEFVKDLVFIDSHQTHTFYVVALFVENQA